MKKKRSKKRVAYLFSGLFLVVVSIVLGATLLGREEVCCVRTDLDTQTGEIREEHYICFILVRQTVTPTDFSRLRRALVGQPSERAWKWANTTSCLGSHSSDYDVGDTIASSRLIGTLLTMHSMPETQKADLIRDCLKMIKEGKAGQLKDVASKLMTELEQPEE